MVWYFRRRKILLQAFVKVLHKQIVELQIRFDVQPYFAKRSFRLTTSDSDNDCFSPSQLQPFLGKYRYFMELLVIANIKLFLPDLLSTIYHPRPNPARGSLILVQLGGQLTPAPNLNTCFPISNFESYQSLVENIFWTA